MNSIVAHLSNLVMQADAVLAYLAALQDTEVYATPPAYWNKLFPNNQAPPGSLLLLLRALYGLCGSARAWGRLLNNILREFNMQQSLHDPCFFIGNAAYLIVHSDDFLVSCAAESIYDDLLDQLGTRMDIKRIGLAKSALGLILEQNPGTILITQQNYISKALSLIRPPSSSASSSSSSATPTPRIIRTVTSTHLNRTATKQYRTVVGVAGWLASMTRPDCATAQSRNIGRIPGTRRPGCHAPAHDEVTHGVRVLDGRGAEVRVARPASPLQGQERPQARFRLHELLHVDIALRHHGHLSYGLAHAFHVAGLRHRERDVARMNRSVRRSRAQVEFFFV